VRTRSSSRTRIFSGRRSSARATSSVQYDHPRFDHWGPLQDLASVMDGAKLEDDVDIGPFARLRRGAHLASRVHMGNFGEVKDSYLAPGVKVGHFSYIGNATIARTPTLARGPSPATSTARRRIPPRSARTCSSARTRCWWRGEDRRRRAHGRGRGGDEGCAADTLVVGMPARGSRSSSGSRRRGVRTMKITQEDQKALIDLANQARQFPTRRTPSTRSGLRCRRSPASLHRRERGECRLPTSICAERTAVFKASRRANASSR